MQSALTAGAAGSREAGATDFVVEELFAWPGESSLEDIAVVRVSV
jgi:hypothetical protein